MTVTYDPRHPQYTDEADVRGELTRVFDVCQGCRLCLDRCGVFPTLFEMVDALPDRDAGRLTPDQQDRVVEQCFHCNLCAVECPYRPEIHELAVDVPRLMLRATAMRRRRSTSLRGRITANVFGRADAVGKLASRSAPLANRIIGAKPGGVLRKAVQVATGVSSVRLLAPYAKERFSTWFKRRPKVRLEGRQGRVAIVPTCLVEYRAPGIGRDLVRVYERNGIECSITDDVACCGAPWLHSGDVDRFRAVAAKNVEALARHVREGNTIVVAEPMCSAVLKHDYPIYAPGEDADLVAAETADACEYLVGIHRRADTRLDTDFPGKLANTITYHAPCHLRAQNIGLKSRDLLKLTGAEIHVVQRCCGGAWGLRGEHAAQGAAMAAELAAAVNAHHAEVVAGDCHLATTAIAEQLSTQPLHPIQVLARAYGLAEEASES